MNPDTPRLAVYTDGGVAKSNPSPYGGAWAVRLVDTETDTVLDARSGVLLPTHISVPLVSNNNAELLAVINAIHLICIHWEKTPITETTATICSDSAIALGWAFGGFSLKRVPDILRSCLWFAKERQKHNGLRIETQLLAGHPTRADLLAGQKIKNGTTYPVSPHNVECDRQCRCICSWLIPAAIDEEITK